MQHLRHIQKTTEGRHWFVAGRTGMGKTKLIKEIIRRLVSLHTHLNVYNLDTKKVGGDFSERDGTVILSEVAPDAYTTGGNRMVWKPIDDNRKEYDIFFKRILQAGLPAIVNIDETVNMKFGDSIPRELGILLYQGRAAGIHVIGGTQRVAQSPQALLSQATYIVSFLLKNPYDEKTMLRALELEQDKLGLRKYQFYFLNTDLDLPAKKYNSYEQLIPLIH